MGNPAVCPSLTPRAFQRWSRNCRSPSGSLANWFFVCFYWGSNPAVCRVIPAHHFYINNSSNIYPAVKFKRCISHTKSIKVKSLHIIWWDVWHWFLVIVTSQLQTSITWQWYQVSRPISMAKSYSTLNSTFKKESYIFWARLIFQWGGGKIPTFSGRDFKRLWRGPKFCAWDMCNPSTFCRGSHQYPGCPNQKTTKVPFFARFGTGFSQKVGALRISTWDVIKPAGPPVQTQNWNST